MRQSSPTLDDVPNDQFDAVIFFFPPPPNALHKSCRNLKKGGRVIILSAQIDGDVVFSANKNVEYVRKDISDILRTPLAFEKLSSQRLRLLESKGALQNLLGIKVESADLTASIKASNWSLEEESPPKCVVNKPSDASFVIQSLATLEEESHLRDIPVLPPGLEECGLKDNRTYLVAGGLGGFGFEVACWMAENGAGTIGLLGRSKPSDAKLQELQQIEMRTGAKIHTFQVHRVFLSFSWLIRQLVAYFLFS